MQKNCAIAPEKKMWENVQEKCSSSWSGDARVVWGADSPRVSRCRLKKLGLGAEKSSFSPMREKKVEKCVGKVQLQPVRGRASGLGCRPPSRALVLAEKSGLCAEKSCWASGVLWSFDNR
jgi:hypothetical protein